MLPQRLLCAAKSFPQRIALQEPSRTLTYSELAARVILLAERFRVRGLNAGDRVALLLPNCIEYVEYLYGALLAGGVVVPLNAIAKAGELTPWLIHCEPAFVVAERSNVELACALERLPSSMRVVYANDPESWASEPLRQELLAAAATTSNHPDDAACIVYTSGTTGRPKGVVLTHANLVANYVATADYLGLSCRDATVAVLPFYFAYGSSVLHSHLISGARLIIEKNLVYPHAIVDALARERATGFSGVPSTYALLLSRVNLGQYDLSTLRYLTQAGGRMPIPLIQRLREALPQRDIFIMYGQTEATARLTYVPPGRLFEKLGSAGIPLRGVSIEIRDEAGRPARTNDVGEIWARGANVMLGYWRDQAATSEVLRDGWLKTGDMGRLDQDGFLFIAGRRSDIIKVGAYRVHPQEIEEVIAELSQVQEAAVVGDDDETLGQTIKAYVVPTAPETITPMQIQAHCRERLANYKVPRSVVFVASLPKTPSGKIRRSQLNERLSE